MSSALFLFAGCTNEKVEQSRALVEEYYESFEDNDPEDILDLFDESLIDLYEGYDLALIVVGSRISILGEEVEYKIIGTSYNKDSEGVYVTYEIINWDYYEADLGNGETIEGVKVVVDSQFGDSWFYNEIIISLEEGNHKIIGHTIEIYE